MPPAGGAPPASGAPRTLEGLNAALAADPANPTLLIARSAAHGAGGSDGDWMAAADDARRACDAAPAMAAAHAAKG